MKNKCTKCSQELLSIYDFGKCIKCSKEEGRLAIIVYSGILIGFLLIVAILRIGYAKWVYKDTRCAWAECRINVNPK